MGKQVLILTSSLRADSNSDGLAEAFARGAREAGHQVEQVSLKGKKLSFCKGCMACLKTQKCAIQDDAVELAEQIGAAEVLVLVSPVYYYSLSGQLKTLLDRCNPLYASDYQFRDVYFLAAAAEDDKRAMEGPVKAIEGWVECFEQARLAGTVFAGGVDAPGEIRGSGALEEAYQMGRKV